MRLSTIVWNGRETAAVVTGKGLVPVSMINAACGKFWPTEMFEIIRTGALDAIVSWHRSGGREKLEKMAAVPRSEAVYAPLYRHPHKIWGIGLNYVDHAGDLAEKAPQGRPGSFPKWDNTIIGHGQEIEIPVQSEKTTGESELGIIYSKECKNVDREDWLSVVAGFTTIIDMTAEDILRLNPRYLTQVKNFDTFFSFGPELVTPDEVEDVNALNVSTVINGKVHAKNVVSNMTFPPDFLISYHSTIATMYPGDVISTGTPRAVHITDGDVIECHIDGFAPLVNPVRDLKIAR